LANVRQNTCVPDSHNAKIRTWGKAAGLRLLPGRPKTRTLLGLSATSSTKPSRAINRMPW
jgi:hypothetical protein